MVNNGLHWLQHEWSGLNHSHNLINELSDSPCLHAVHALTYAAPTRIEAPAAAVLQDLVAWSYSNDRVVEGSAVFTPVVNVSLLNRPIIDLIMLLWQDASEGQEGQDAAVGPSFAAPTSSSRQNKDTAMRKSLLLRI